MVMGIFGFWNWNREEPVLTSRTGFNYSNGSQPCQKSLKHRGWSQRAKTGRGVGSTGPGRTGPKLGVV